MPTTTKSLDDIMNKKRNIFQRYGIAGYNYWYWMRNPHKLYKIITYYIRRIRWFIQRGKNGYATCDLWSLDTYILSWLPNAIGEFRSNLHSYPSSITYDEWQAILEKIENGLRIGDYFTMSKEEYDEAHAKFIEAWTLMGKHFFSLWD